MEKRFIWLLCLFCFTACLNRQFIPDYASDGSLEEQLTDLYENGQLPGFAVAIVNKE